MVVNSYVKRPGLPIASSTLQYSVYTPCQGHSFCYAHFSRAISLSRLFLVFFHFTLRRWLTTIDSPGSTEYKQGINIYINKKNSSFVASFWSLLMVVGGGGSGGCLAIYKRRETRRVRLTFTTTRLRRAARERRTHL